LRTTNFNIVRGLFLGLFFLALLNPTFASESADKTSDLEEKEFQTSELIFHHIKDSYGFHVAGDFSVPLPMILWTDNGLVTFMSSEFHHDAEGKVIVERDGMKFVNIHEKVYQLDPGASEVTFDASHHATNAHRPMDFSITKNIFMMLLSFLVLILLFTSAARSYKKKGNNMPSGIGRFVEPLIVFVRDEIAIPNIGEKNYKRFMPFLLTMFFFIWLNNIFGLIPFFPFSANLSGNIAFTVTLALFTFIITLASSKSYYWSHMLWMPGLPVPMKLFLAPIELIGMFIKPIALTIRLFANITAGHVIVLSLISLIFMFKSYYVAPLSVAFSLFITIIEVLVVAIQAYIFTLLSAMYFGQAVEEAH